MRDYFPHNLTIIFVVLFVSISLFSFVVGVNASSIFSLNGFRFFSISQKQGQQRMAYDLKSDFSSSVDKKKKVISLIWRDIRFLKKLTDEQLEVLNDCLGYMDAGWLRLNERDSQGNWVINSWAEEVLLIYNCLPSNVRYKEWKSERGVKSGVNYDFRSRVSSRFGSLIEFGCYIGNNVRAKLSYLRSGSFISDDVRIGSHSSIELGSYIGSGCYIARNVGVGYDFISKKIEPTIIEDNCYIGHGCEVTGVIVGASSIIEPGVCIDRHTPIIDNDSGEVIYGKVPPYSHLVSGFISGVSSGGAPSVSCVIRNKISKH